MTARLAAALAALRERLEALPPAAQEAAVGGVEALGRGEPAWEEAVADARTRLSRPPDPSDTVAWTRRLDDAWLDYKACLLTGEEIEAAGVANWGDGGGGAARAGVAA